MKKLVLICLFLSLCSMQCINGKKLNCTDCYDKEAVLKELNIIAEKKLKDKIDSFEVEIEEETDFYTVIYTNIQRLNDPLKKGGGGFLIKVSKKDCKVVEYSIEK